MENLANKLFIIGAGAHVEYGLPTGAVLEQNIKYLTRIMHLNLM